LNKTRRPLSVSIKTRIFRHLRILLGNYSRHLDSFTRRPGGKTTFHSGTPIRFCHLSRHAKFKNVAHFRGTSIWNWLASGHYWVKAQTHTSVTSFDRYAPTQVTSPFTMEQPPADGEWDRRLIHAGADERRGRKKSHKPRQTIAGRRLIRRDGGRRQPSFVDLLRGDAKNKQKSNHGEVGELRYYLDV
jgi:hypothetical protein